VCSSDLTFHTTKAAQRFYAVGSRPLTEEEKVIRFEAYALKSPECPNDILRDCAYAMAMEIDADCILIPVPDHTGDTKANRRLAHAIAQDAPTGIAVDVRDLLTRSHPVPSTCARHKERRGPLPVEAHCITVREHRPFPLKRVYFVDNVITSGNTLEACAQALGFGTALFSEKGATKVLNRRMATRFSQKRGKTGPQAGRVANAPAVPQYPVGTSRDVGGSCLYPVALSMRVSPAPEGRRRRGLHGAIQPRYQPRRRLRFSSRPRGNGIPSGSAGRRQAVR
jgi:hypothetical protein